jgi:hypothetical protein
VNVFRRLTHHIIHLLLILQLAVGMQLPIAQSASSAPLSTTQDPGGEHCPAHHATTSGKELPSPSPHGPAKHHDCCRSIGCQCHCTQAPVLLDLTPTVTAHPYGVSALDFETRADTARADDFFRPPIP